MGSIVVVLPDAIVVSVTTQILISMGFLEAQLTNNEISTIEHCYISMEAVAMPLT